MQAVMPQLFTQAMGGTDIEVCVQQDPRPDRHPQRAFRDHARCWGRRHNAGDLRTLTGLLVTRALDASNMGLDLDFDDGGFFGTGKRCERLAACWAVFRVCPTFYTWRFRAVRLMMPTVLREPRAVKLNPPSEAA